MRFFKKIDITKENKKLGDEYMPSGTIRVLNPYEVQKNVAKFGEGDDDSSSTEIFKKVDTYKKTTREFQDGETGNSAEDATKTRHEEPEKTEEERNVEDVPSKEQEDAQLNHSDSDKLTSF